MSKILLNDRRAHPDAPEHEQWRREMEETVYYAGTANFDRGTFGHFRKNGAIGFHIPTRRKQIFGDYQMSQPEPTERPEWFSEEGPKREKPPKVEVQQPPIHESWGSLQAKSEKAWESFKDKRVSKNPFSAQALKDGLSSCKHRLSRRKSAEDGETKTREETQEEAMPPGSHTPSECSDDQTTTKAGTGVISAVYRISSRSS